jgi:hypothetical protein
MHRGYMQMHNVIRRAAIVVGATITALALGTGSALAHECVNPSKKGPAGAQITFGDGDEPVSMTKGVAKRIEKGIIDPETGEGFHGLIGFDLDGDGVADLTTWQVTPTGSIPETAQFNGPACKGMTNVELYFSECLDE